MVDKLTFSFGGDARLRIGGQEINLKEAAATLAYQGRLGERTLQGFKHSDGTFFRLKRRAGGGVDLLIYGEPDALSRYRFKVLGGELTKARLDNSDFRRTGDSAPGSGPFTVEGRQLFGEARAKFLQAKGLVRRPISAVPPHASTHTETGRMPQADPRLSHAGPPDSRSGLALIDGQDAQPRGQCQGLGFHYTSWGTRHSLGSLTTSALKVLTLSPAFRWVGAKIQGGHSQGVRYWTGAGFKLVANLTSGLAGLVGGTVSWGEAVVSNLGGAALRLVSGQRSKISFLTKGKQQIATPDLAREALPKALMSSASGRSGPGGPLPEGYRFASRELIPPALLSRENGGTGEMGLMRFESGRLINDRWSALRVGVFVGPQDEIYLSFVGTQPSTRPATLKSDIVQALGIKDTAFHDADKLLRAFKQAYPDRSINVIGHSLGGALATYAGIRNQLPVTAFNSAGLSLGLRNSLGADAIDAATVVHINTTGDPLSQRVEGRRFGILPTSQVGVRYRIPDSGGHRTIHVIQGLEQLARSDPPQTGAELKSGERVEGEDWELIGEPARPDAQAWFEYGETGRRSDAQIAQALARVAGVAQPGAPEERGRRAIDRLRDEAIKDSARRAVHTDRQVFERQFTQIIESSKPLREQLLLMYCSEDAEAASTEALIRAMLDAHGSMDEVMAKLDDLRTEFVLEIAKAPDQPGRGPIPIEDALTAIGLAGVAVPDDGHCQFAAIAFGVGGVWRDAFLNDPFAAANRIRKELATRAVHMTGPEIEALSGDGEERSISFLTDSLRVLAGGIDLARPDPAVWGDVRSLALAAALLKRTVVAIEYGGRITVFRADGTRTTAPLEKLSEMVAVGEGADAPVVIYQPDSVHWHATDAALV